MYACLRHFILGYNIIPGIIEFRHTAPISVTLDEPLFSSLLHIIEVGEITSKTVSFLGSEGGAAMRNTRYAIKIQDHCHQANAFCNNQFRLFSLSDILQKCTDVIVFHYSRVVQ